MMRKDLISFAGLDRRDFDRIFERAFAIKRMQKEGVVYTPLKGKTLGMTFFKSSTRTRLSFEVGMYQLGGIAIFLSARDIQVGRGESIEDTARIMSRYLDGVVVRTFSQESVEEFARAASIPVVNGLTDLLHPCQILSDLFTISEKKGTYEGVKVAYVGDGNNIANSLIEAATRLPFELALACPEEYEPNPEILRAGVQSSGGRVRLFRQPSEAVEGADVVYTDVWASMGQEGEAEKRKQALKDYQINAALMKRAKRDAVVMHCLPAHRGEEITADVIDGPQSVVFDQAENRLHVQKAILEILMGGGKET
ncbi:MAG TPA: ornithine carbamoyltransferase [Syntrophales bacterium]|nr:ornithine carbamoyltransferase [Syntrophales bacterium]